MTTISPNEFVLLNDSPHIRTKCPPAAITDEMILKRVRNGNLAVGDSIRVQCMDATYEHLLAETEYRVTARRAALKTIEINDRDTRQVEEIAYSIVKVREWVRFTHADLPVEKPAEGPRERYVDGQAVMAWNVGRRLYEIKIGDRVVATHPDKETASRIAAGELPLPEKEAA